MNKRLVLLLTLFLAIVALPLASELKDRPQAGVALSQPTSQTSVDAVIEALSSVHGFNQVALAPDGTKVAWVEDATDGNGWGSTIYVQDLRRGAAPRRISALRNGGNYSEHDIAWSPDASQIAFLSNAASPQQEQLFVANVANGQVKKLTNLTGYMTTPGWAPDGKVIAMLFIENAPRRAGPLEPMTPDAGVVEEKIYEQRITTVEVASGRIRQVSPADMYVYEYDWSPDSKNFIVSAAHGSGDNNWWIAQLYTVSLDSGQARSILKPPLQIANPRWSPDGKNIAYIGGIMSDQGSTGGDVFIVPVKGGTARNLTAGIKSSPSWLAWVGSDRIVFTEIVDGSSGIETVSISDGKVFPLWKGDEAITGADWGISMSLSRDGNTSAVVRSGFQSPPDIWSGPIGKWEQITKANSGVQSNWGSARNVHWNSDGLRVQGWLLLPRDYDPSQRYPLVVNVHGGPAGACLAGWPGLLTVSLSTAGYFVLCPNPRGSYGQGEAFTQGNVKDFGGGDFRDIVAGVDQVIKEFPVDKDRIGIRGHSYGGYMTMWAVTQTDRFRAAVAGAGLSNWQSYYGQNDIDQWMIPYFGASVYDDPAVYAKSSPINFVKKAKTPTLILVGDRDGEVPAPQSYEWHHALKTLGVPTQLVVYPNEGHRISQPVHVRDMTVRTVEWFNRYLGAKEGQLVKKGK